MTHFKFIIKKFFKTKIKVQRTYDITIARIGFGQYNYETIR